MKYKESRNFIRVKEKKMAPSLFRLNQKSFWFVSQVFTRRITDKRK